MSNQFSLGGSGAEKTWSYSDPTSNLYSPEITGTVVELAQVQVRDIKTRQPAFWDDGNPKMQFRIAVLRDDAKNPGVESTWYFNKKGIAAEAVKKALGGTDLTKMLGMRVRIATAGTSYINGANTRVWEFEMLGPGNAQAVRGVIEQPIMAQAFTQNPNMPYQGQPMQPQYPQGVPVQGAALMNQIDYYQATGQMQPVHAHQPYPQQGYTPSAPVQNSYHQHPVATKPAIDPADPLASIPTDPATGFSMLVEDEDGFPA